MMTQVPETVPPPRKRLEQRFQEIVFVDAAIANYPLLVAGAAPGVEVVVIGCERDGIEQITQVLRKRRELLGLHLVCPGGAGSLQLGTATLNLTSFERYVWDLTLWSNALAPDAELLIYGSEIARGIRGEELIGQLSQLIGVPVAASCSKTGSAKLGGNWTLEMHTAPCKTPLVFSSETIDQYDGLL